MSDKKKSKTKKARVLIDTNISGVRVPCGGIIEHDESEIVSLENAGVVDSSIEAVQFALDNGADLLAVKSIVDVSNELDLDTNIDAE